MSLATRCTSCGTVFRVVQDQLKVSEGWVRCGRCDSVFNALEGLFDLERDAPPEWSTPPQSAAAAVVDLPLDEAAEAQAELEQDPSLVDRIDEQIFGSRRSAFGALTGLGRSDRGADFADARFDSVPPDAPTAAPAPADSDATAAPIDAPPITVQEEPGFVREAERRTRWQGSAARRILGIATLLSGLLLAAQVAHRQRDDIAAHWPELRPALQAWCGWTSCTVSAPRRIEDLSVESTALARGSAADAFRLSVTLRNRGALPVALPWLELSLTDANGELVARRALSPLDLHAPSSAMAAGAETVLSALLSTGTTRITGYTVEIFYP